MIGMPELPEVETVRSVIEPQVRGRIVEEVKVLNERVVAYPDPETFRTRLTGRAIAGMDRRGKLLSFLLDGGDRLFLHLRMTGRLLAAPPSWPGEKHTHLILRLSDGNELRYIDPRRFGRFWYIARGEPTAITGFDALGPEPTDERLTAEYLKDRLAQCRRPIKEMLHDQTVIAGIGNIYSDEILFEARICPLRPCETLTEAEWRALAQTIPRLIRFEIEASRITPEEYLAGQGREYRNTPYLKVYGHAGEKCPRCGAALVRATVCGRTATWCPACQKAPD